MKRFNSQLVKGLITINNVGQNFTEANLVKSGAISQETIDILISKKIVSRMKNTKGIWLYVSNYSNVVSSYEDFVRMIVNLKVSL